MADDPATDGPMACWPEVAAVDGAAETLRRIKPGRTLVLATGAEVSTEAEVRQALARVRLDEWIDRVFCYQNTGVKKADGGFYPLVLERLGARPDEALMVGDSYEKDAAAANRAGMRAVWFNPRSAEERSGPLLRTIHRLAELPVLL